VNEEQTGTSVNRPRLRHLPVVAGDRGRRRLDGDLVKSVTAQVETIHYLEGYITGGIRPDVYGRLWPMV
jgi:hypothetical protein